MRSAAYVIYAFLSGARRIARQTIARESAADRPADAEGARRATRRNSQANGPRFDGPLDIRPLHGVRTG